MKSVSSKEGGFSPIETIIVLVILLAVVITGAVLAHRNHKPAAQPKRSALTLSSKQPTNSLQSAATQVGNVYNAYYVEVLNPGRPLDDKSAWAANNPQVAKELQFINLNGTWFTSSFSSKAGSYKAADSVPSQGSLLFCSKDIPALNRGSFFAVGKKLSGTTAQINLWYSTGGGVSGPALNHQLPITAKLQKNKTWQVDSVDLSVCK